MPVGAGSVGARVGAVGVQVVGITAGSGVSVEVGTSGEATLVGGDDGVFSGRSSIVGVTMGVFVGKTGVGEGNMGGKKATPNTATTMLMTGTIQGKFLGSCASTALRSTPSTLSNCSGLVGGTTSPTNKRTEITRSTPET